MSRTYGTGAACLQCNKMLSSAYHLERHLLRHVDKPDAYKCKKCPMAFAYQRNLVAHVRDKHRDIEWKLCSLCSTVFKSARSMREHQARAHGVPTPGALYCPVKNCKFVGFRPTKMAIHLARVHRAPPA
jgi:hypothetical protein